MRTINIDLDGVLADFYPAATKVLGVPYKSIEPVQVWGVLEHVDNFFLNLPLKADARALWDGLQGCGPLRILTATPKPTRKLATAPADKLAWVRRHFSDTIPVFVVAHGLRKAELAKRGDILIDDLKRNIDAWELAGGTGILHTNAADTLKKLKAVLGKAP